jgi:hypothetical protein
MEALSGGVARNIINSMRKQLGDLPTTCCRGRSATEQGCGNPNVATSGVQDFQGELATTKDRNFCAFLFGTCCVIRWMLDDCFHSGRKMRATDDYELTVRAVMRVILEAMEMGGLARQFPHVAFSIGACAETWKAPEACNLFADAAKLGVALAGDNVASGVHDHASISELLFKDNWRYAKGTEDKAAIVMTAWVVREVEYAVMIAAGPHTYPSNYSETGVGVALVAADAQGDAIVAKDAYGLGDPETDVSPARWSLSHGGKRPPETWAWAGVYDDVLGQPVNVAADIPRARIPGVMCDPEAVSLDYQGSKIYSLSPGWLNRLGLEQMAARQVRAGESTHLTGLDGIDQMVDRELGPMRVAIQIRDFGLLGE